MLFHKRFDILRRTLYRARGKGGAGQLLEARAGFQNVGNGWVEIAVLAVAENHPRLAIIEDKAAGKAFYGVKQQGLATPQLLFGLFALGDVDSNADDSPLACSALAGQHPAATAKL